LQGIEHVSRRSIRKLNEKHTNLEDALFDRILNDEPRHEHRLGLAETMHSVDRLATKMSRDQCGKVVKGSLDALPLYSLVP